MVKRRSIFYLLGLFITSLGSLTYAATLPVVLFQIGVSTLFIGFLIGSMRINSFLVNSFLGHIGDRFNPLSVLIVCEFGAAIGSLLILLSWKTWGVEWLVPFAVANNIRVFFTALQAGSVQKLGKNFDTLLTSNGRFAVKISGATNGALLFGGVIAIIFFERLDVSLLVWFDTATFLLNGLIVLVMQSSVDHQVSSTNGKRISLNIPAYYKALPILAFLDVALSLALTGSNTLNLRLLESTPQLVPLMPTLFGGAAFICSFGLDRKFGAASRPMWLILGISLLAQGWFASSPIFVLVFTIIRNFAYWIIYNSISREIMKSAPASEFSSISSGRIALSVSVLAIGELWVGATRHVAIVVEMMWRSFVAVVVALGPRKANEK